MPRIEAKRVQSRSTSPTQSATTGMTAYCKNVIMMKTSHVIVSGSGFSAN